MLCSAISFDSDIQRDGSGKMLRAKLDCCTFLQEFGTNSDGWAILDCWTGYWPARSWHRAASTQLQQQHHGNRRADSSTKCFHSTQSISWYSTDVSAFIFIGFRRTHIGEYIRDDIDHQIFFLASSGRYQRVFSVDTHVLFRHEKVNPQIINPTGCWRPRLSWSLFD